MATKTANVNARMQSDIKQEAEAILQRLGIPRSVAIEMFYRQIIVNNGIPFPVTLSPGVPIREDMTRTEFDNMIGIGLRQAKSGDGFDADDVFSELEAD
ncbi:MAG: type II toxin-antitoxin system RelB/DinJ family antitoxin [Clostridiales bacterium]|nr:type II toxin-antitoxin system RelB/DinJ family antitoxin [Clostridiales bacterium]